MIETSSLRKPQVRVLKALTQSKTALTRKEISEKAEVDVSGLTEWIGSSDQATRKANDKKHFPSLLSLGLVSATEKDGEPTAYSITGKGRKALA